MLIASEVSAFVVIHNDVVKGLLIALGAGVGSIAIAFPFVWIGSWTVASAVTLPRQLSEAVQQRDKARDEITRMMEGMSWLQEERSRLSNQVAVLTTERDHARTELDALHAEAPVFPRCAISIKPFFYVPVPEEQRDPIEELVLVFKARATNREELRPINLTFDIALVWEPRKEVRPLRSRLIVSHAKTNRKFEADVLPGILEIDPGRTKEGVLKFMARADEPFVVFADDEFTPRDQARFVATVHDYVSGESATFDVPGEWSS